MAFSVGIALIARIVKAPKVWQARMYRWKVKKQEDVMTVELAELVAIKLRELSKWADIYGEVDPIITASWGGVLMQTALQKFRSPRWRLKHGVESRKATAEEAFEYGCCAPVHTVIENDEHNQPQTDVARISIPTELEEVYQIPWAERLKAYLKADLHDEFFAVTVFENAVQWLHRMALVVNLATKAAITTDRPYPIAMQRMGGCVVVKALEDIDYGCLVIPVFVRRDFIRSYRDSKTVRWNMEVAGSVEWRDGPDDRDVKVLIHCQPERKLPAGTRLGDSDYDQSMACHPFWHIRRSSCVTECNCEIVEVAIKSLMCSDMREVTTEGNTPKLVKSNLEVVVPCIRNTAEIAAGQELVLRWEKKDGKKDGRCPLRGVKRVSIPRSEQAPSPKKGRM